MSFEISFPWVMLIVLGAAHGINPAMGWLFAVSLGLQEGSGRAVWRALGPLAFGHALAIAAALLAAAALGMVVPLVYVKWIAAAALLTFGIAQLVRHRHPRLAGMRVGAKDLAVWSFIMASAHGAGLMAVPFVLELSGAKSGPEGSGIGAHGAHAAHTSHGNMTIAGLTGETAGFVATLLHTGGYLLVAGLVAFVVYRKLGLRLLRTAWINLNVVWAGALILTALLTPLL
jgi:hypothetical protein